MAEQLTEENFSRHLNTKFRVKLDAPRPVELELVAVNGYQSGPNEQQGMERFSVIFSGPADIFLQQHLYSLEHEQMGELAIFLVPLGRNERGFRYEAVFNYFK